MGKQRDSFPARSGSLDGDVPAVSSVSPVPRGRNRWLLPGPRTLIYLVPMRCRVPCLALSG